jgi:hypothetical protein
LHEKVAEETQYKREMFTISKNNAVLTQSDETELASLGIIAGKPVTVMLNKSESFKDTRFDTKGAAGIEAMLSPTPAPRHASSEDSSDDTRGK